MKPRRWLSRVALLAFAVTGGLGVSVALAAAPVVLSEADEVIPTYLSEPPDPNPMFYFGR